MNWDDFRIFLALARASTLAAAALKLDLDATTVARRVRRLERLLNTELFEVNVGGVSLTSAGQRLLAYAEAVEQATMQAGSDLTGERGLLAGTVRVSIAEGLGTWMIARHLKEFHEANPDIHIELVATNGFLNPSKREADLAIMLARPARGPLIARKLTDYRLKLYAARSYVAERGLPACIAEVRDHTLVGYISDFIYAEELRYLDELSDALEPTLASSSINVQHALVSAGAGIGILPSFIGERDPRLIRVLDDEVAVTRSFWRVVHRDVATLARVRTFLAWLDALVEREREILLV